MTKKKRDCTAREFIDTIMENLSDGGFLRSTLEIDDGALEDEHLLFRNLYDRYKINLDPGAAKKLTKDGKLSRDYFGDSFPQNDRRVESLELKDGTLYAHLKSIQSVRVLGGLAYGTYVHDTDTDSYVIVYKGDDMGYKYNPEDGLEVAIDLFTGTIGFWEDGKQPMRETYYYSDYPHRSHLNKYTPVYALTQDDLEVVADSIYNPWRKIIDCHEIDRSVARVYNGVKYKYAHEFWTWVKQLVAQVEYVNEHPAIYPFHVTNNPLASIGFPEEYISRYKTIYRPDFQNNLLVKYQTKRIEGH